MSERSGLTDPVGRSESCDGPSGGLGLHVNIQLSGKAARTPTSPLLLLTHQQEEPAEVVQIQFIRLAGKANERHADIPSITVSKKICHFNINVRAVKRLISLIAMNRRIFMVNCD